MNHIHRSAIELPLVSIIIPCYNCEQFVSRAIESVFQQTYKNWELILVNNNSTDNTAEIINSYQTKYSNNIRVFNENEKGSPATRNRGLGEAKGDWVQYLDADDELYSNKLERQLSMAMSKCCDVIVGSYFKQIAKDNFVREISNADNIWHSLISSKLGITSANLWKKDKIAQVNGWDLNITSSQEYDLMFRILQTGSDICADKEISTTIYASENSLTRDKKPERSQEIISNWLALRLRIKKYLEENGKFDENSKKFFDEFVYEKFTLYKNSISPKFINELLFPLDLEVPLKKKVEIHSKYYEYKLRKLGRKQIANMFKFLLV